MPAFNPTIHCYLRQPSNRSRCKTLIGRKFNRLTPLGFLGMIGKSAQWLCRCDCGTFWVSSLSNLEKGDSQSCGCWNLEKRPWSKTHGISKTLVHRIWSGIRTRIYNQNHHSYPRYGGRGLTLCAGMQTFEGFYAVVGEPPTESHSIDRWPNNKDGGYWCGQCDECLSKSQPKNVRWATPKEQSANMQKNVWLTANNETHILSEWARICHLDHETIRARLKRGLSDEEALGFKERKRKNAKR